MVEEKWLKRSQVIVESMLNMLQEEGKNLKILDAGCGNGLFSEQIIKIGNEVWGIDENKVVLKEAKKRGVKIFEGDLEKNFPFENEFFDGIWCKDVLEHIFYTEKFLKECHRILKPKGVLIITARNIASFSNRIRLIFGIYPLNVAPSEKGYPGDEHPHPRFADHKRVFTKSIFEEVLKRLGFEVEKITSDFVCFNFGRYNDPPWSEFLGKIFPVLGEVLIAKARK